MNSSDVLVRKIYEEEVLAIKDEALKASKTQDSPKKKVYYISAEFLMGRLLGNNLLNSGRLSYVKEKCAKEGVAISDVLEAEPEPSLGNGGLGRLAACFLDSMASVGIAGDGIGLNYHYGLFKQEFKDNLQNAVPNPWIESTNWLIKTDMEFDVEFTDRKVHARMYDVPVVGYENRTNFLHLFDIDSVDESIVKDGIDFDKKDIEKNLTLFLYPDDSDEDGRKLRVYQQYFMVSAAARLILKESKERGSDLHDLADFAAVQINDTHPSMVIPELIRLLEKEGIGFDEAVKIVIDVCAYTNHTILAEALEKWPLDYIEEVAMPIVPIIKKLDKLVKAKFDDESVAIIDDQMRVHMAHMDIHYTHSTNGVAYLHTEILKNEELNNFYKIYPEKFNNKTNGITFRRWLLSCNEELSEFINELVGDPSKLLNLMGYVEDDAVLERLLEIKSHNKERFAAFIKETQGIEINSNSIFDVQVKRLHEYKRQQMNVLYVIYKYLQIKKGIKPSTPITVIFGAKAAPAYVIAKDIIHVILCLQELIEKDPEVSPYLKVVMIENYNVSKAELVIPACDISEQISLASKEASGTGNMKFMLNGAVTLGTMDGANVEIASLVGEGNIYTFGKSSDEIIEHYKKADYVAKDFYDGDELIKELVDFIVDEKMLAIGHKENLERLHRELIVKDWFMTLIDLKEYIEVRDRVYKDYEDRKSFAKKMLVNIAKAGFFSSDRTILEYDRDIWKSL